MFLKFISVGALNTAIHWLTFAGLVWFGSSQALANLLAFCIAVTFSFFANARWTFKSNASLSRYCVFVGFMGVLAFGTGWIAERVELRPLATVVVFSAVSLVCGYAYSRLVVFRTWK